VPQALGETTVFQVGFGGINLGRLDLTFGPGRLLAASGGPVAIQGGRRTRPDSEWERVTAATPWPTRSVRADHQSLETG
jgi:hypothetical protein